MGKDIYISASALFMPEKTIANRFSILIAVWQEVFDNNLHFNQNETIVNVWKDWGRGWKRTVNDVSVIHASLSSDKGLKRLFTGDEGRVQSSAVGPLVPQLYQLWLRLDKILQNRPFVFRR